MAEPFEPKNDLEQRLLDAQEGRIPGEEFLQTLLGSQVFMPVRDEYQIANFQASDKAVPLTLEAEDGTRLLVLFTSPERGRGFLQDYPEYVGGLLDEFSWVLQRVGSGIGISINPGSEVGLELDPDMVAQLAAAVQGAGGDGDGS